MPSLARHLTVRDVSLQKKKRGCREGHRSPKEMDPASRRKNPRPGGVSTIASAFRLKEFTVFRFWGCFGEAMSAALREVWWLPVSVMISLTSGCNSVAVFGALWLEVIAKKPRSLGCASRSTWLRRAQRACMAQTPQPQHVSDQVGNPARNACQEPPLL